MKVSVEEVSQTTRKVVVELPEDQVQRQVQQAYRELGRSARIKGFRRGKVPLPILKRFYGEQVQRDVTLQLVNDTLVQALEQGEVEAVSRPELEPEPLEEGKPFRYTVHVEVKPEIEVKDYRGIPVRRPPVQVDDKTVEDELERRRQANAFLRSIADERPVQLGDVVILDIKAYTEGKPLAGGEATGMHLEVGANRFHPDFESRLVGASKSDRAEITVNFPPDYGNELFAGKEVTFEVTVTDIKERIVPELNDDFARDLGDYDSLEDLRRAVRQQLERQQRKEAEAQVRQQLLEALIARNPFEVPAAMVERELQSMYETLRYRLATQQLTPEQVGIKAEDFAAQRRPQAEKNVKAALILERLAEQEDIQVTPEDVEKTIEKTAADMGEPADKLRDFYERNQMMDMIRRQVREDKVFELLSAQAEITEAPVEKSEPEEGKEENS